MISQPFRIEDLYLQRKPSDLQCAPERPLVACVVRSVDREQDRYVSCPWALDLDGRRQWQLTRGPGEDHSPRWSPSGDELGLPLRPLPRG